MDVALCSSLCSFMSALQASWRRCMLPAAPYCKRGTVMQCFSFRPARDAAILCCPLKGNINSSASVKATQRRPLLRQFMRKFSRHLLSGSICLRNCGLWGLPGPAPICGHTIADELKPRSMLRESSSLGGQVQCRDIHAFGYTSGWV